SKRVTRTSRHRQSVQPIAEQLPLCRRQDASCLAEQCLQRDGVYRGPFSRRCRVGSSVWASALAGTVRVVTIASRMVSDLLSMPMLPTCLSSSWTSLTTWSIRLGVNPLGVGELRQVGVAAA